MDPTQGDSSGESKKTKVDATANEDDAQDLPMLGNNSKLEKQSSTSSSSSSDTSSEEDFIQLEGTKLSKPVPASSATDHLASKAEVQNGKASGVTAQSLSIKPGSLNLLDDDTTFPRYPRSDQPSVGRPFSPRVDDIRRPLSTDLPVSHPSSDNFGTTGAMQSPLNQMMARNDVPDPNRIPSSIFTRTKSTTPMEWSVASNESLFSIHMGNSSFSRDHVFLLGRSGELTNFSSSTLDGYTPPISPATSGPLSVGVGQGLAEPGAAEVANAEAMKEVLRAAAEGHADKDKEQLEGAPHSTSISRNSDGSMTSFRSFAFPILTGDRSGSLKVEPEHQTMKLEQLHQPATPAETPKAPPPLAPASAGNRWFPCLSCSFCC